MATRSPDRKFSATNDNALVESPRMLIFSTAISVLAVGGLGVFIMGLNEGWQLHQHSAESVRWTPIAETIGCPTPSASVAHLKPPRRSSRRCVWERSIISANRSGAKLVGVALRALKHRRELVRAWLRGLSSGSGRITYRLYWYEKLRSSSCCQTFAGSWWCSRQPSWWNWEK
jgi:hypothetical protein